MLRARHQSLQTRATVLNLGHGDCAIPAALELELLVTNAFGYASLPSDEFFCTVRLEVHNFAPAYVFDVVTLAYVFTEVRAQELFTSPR